MSHYCNSVYNPTFHYFKIFFIKCSLYYFSTYYHGLLYLAVLESLVEDSCPGSQKPNTQGVQHHPFAPVNHTICQLSGAEGMDSSSKALCNTLER